MIICLCRHKPSPHLKVMAANLLGTATKHHVLWNSLVCVASIIYWLFCTQGCTYPLWLFVIGERSKVKGYQQCKLEKFPSYCSCTSYASNSPATGYAILCGGVAFAKMNHDCSSEFGQGNKGACVGHCYHFFLLSTVWWCMVRRDWDRSNREPGWRKLASLGVLPIGTCWRRGCGLCTHL